MTIQMVETEEFSKLPLIKVIGVGGGGGNAVTHMIASNVQGVDFICANTDAQALAHCNAPNIIQLGIKGMGAGGKPETGREVAEAAVDEIRQMIEGADMLFITVGMGGGTGTGAAPVIARIAQEMGILVVGVVTKPFDWEGGRRMKQADEGIAELGGNVNSLIVVLNEKLHDVMGEEVGLEAAFAAGNDVLKDAVGGISGIIHHCGMVNVDFEDVRSVMSEPGKAIMGIATATGPDRARIAAEQAIACPLLEGVDLAGAKGVIVVVTASKNNLKLTEIKLAVGTVKNYASTDANVIFGANIDDNLGDALQVTVIATGLESHSAARNSQTSAIQVVAGGLRTGTTGGLTGGGIENFDYPQQKGFSMPSTASSEQGNMVGSSVLISRRDRATLQVDAMSAKTKKDDVNIPTFLRKQAD